MFMDFIFILLILLNIEAVTNILSKSEFFRPLRKFLFNRYNNNLFKFLHNLLDCPYCTSVWVSFCYISAWYFTGYFYILSSAFVFICLVIAFHRLSNILHYLIDRLDRNDINSILMDKENDK